MINNRLLENAVAELSKLPGIGSKTALRLALHMLRQPQEYTESLSAALSAMRSEITYCRRCHNISDKPVCDICNDKSRDDSMICVVENIKDVITIESTHEYRGLYHVLGGLISPIDGIGPADIELQSLFDRVVEEHTQEVILALSPTMEGDTTSFYIARKLFDCDCEITMLARGISIGNDLELADELTLGRSIQNRIPYSDTLNGDL